MPKVFLIGESHDDYLSVLFGGKLAMKYDIKLAIEGGRQLVKKKEFMEKLIDLKISKKMIMD